MKGQTSDQKKNNHWRAPGDTVDDASCSSASRVEPGWGQKEKQRQHQNPGKSCNIAKKKTREGGRMKRQTRSDRKGGRYPGPARENTEEGKISTATT